MKTAVTVDATTVHACDEEKAIRREIVSLLPRLRRFSLSLTGTRQDADDLLQTALERALVRIHLYRPGSRLDSWMFRIIQNVRIDQVRAAGARPAAVSFDEAMHAAAGAGVAEGVEREITLAQTLAAMQRLSEEQRATLVLVCVEGLRYREAAQVLDISVGTVMSRLARARRRLHEMVHGVRDHEERIHDHR